MAVAAKPSPYAARTFDSITSQGLNTLRKALRLSNSNALGRISRVAAKTGVLFRKRKNIPLKVRALISLCQPIDPLKKVRNLPEIELVVPFVEKDLDALPLVLTYAKKNVRNPIARVVLITPRGEAANTPRFSLPESFLKLEQTLAHHSDATVIYDQELLGDVLLNELELRFGQGDRNAGWVNQQLIKLSAAMQAQSEAALILDADTVLLSPKSWFTPDKVQLLQIANEYHTAFMRHVEIFFDVPKELRLSFVTHHQLMQREIVQAMFPQGSLSLLEWWKSSTDPIGRDLGDYEAYGSYLVHHFPQRVAFGSFGNLFSPHLTQFMKDVQTSNFSASELIPDYCSVSFHSWAQVDRAERGN